MSQISSAGPARYSTLKINILPATLAAMVIAFGTLAIGHLIDARQSMLFLIRCVMGAALYHGSFGFTGGWRRLVVERRGAAMRAQLLMIGVAAAAMIPLLELDSFGGRTLAGAVAPVGVSVVVGAALFGLGMQLGGGCGSGTLFALGGGSTRMIVTLFFFIAGALIGTAHLPWWLTLPSLPPVSVGRSIGAAAGTGVTLVALALIGALTTWIEHRAHGSLERPVLAENEGLARLVKGPWPLIGAGISLGMLNIATCWWRAIPGP